MKVRLLYGDEVVKKAYLGSLASRPSSATYFLCDLQQLARPRPLAFKSLTPFQSSGMEMLNCMLPASLSSPSQKQGRYNFSWGLSHRKTRYSEMLRNRGEKAGRHTLSECFYSPAERWELFSGTSDGGHLF